MKKDAGCLFSKSVKRHPASFLEDSMSENPRPTTRPKNAFETVTVASQRARQLLEGCTPKVEGSPKPARRALQEVSRGAVTRQADTDR
jgi:DNA-directed RNA polymerase subunit K/omega